MIRNIPKFLEMWRAEEELNNRYWPYQFEITEWEQVRHAERFCYNSFKSRNWRNSGRYFGFKRQQDYEWFLLGWV